MRIPLIFAAAAALLIVSISGCSNDRAGRALIDDLGRSVALKHPPERVVTLAPNLTEIVFEAGAGGRLVGVGEPDDYPPAIDTLPRYSTYPVDFEAITALQPDLALATTQVNSPRDAATLEALGIPTYFLTFESLEDVFEGIATVGRLLGTEADAQRAVDSLRREAERLRSQTERVGNRPRVLFIIGTETLFAFGKGSYIHELIELAGGRSVTSEIEAAAPVLTDEYVLAAKPEVIVGPWSDDPEPAELLEHHPTWELVPAVRSGRIIGVDGSLVERPGPRLIMGARQMARKLHPDLFDHGPSPRGDTMR